VLTRPPADCARHGSPRAAQIELLLMRAMSLELIRGEIDEVEQIIIVSWVQPRVLTTAQIANMSVLLQGWKTQVKTTLSFLESEAPEFGQDAHF
jgi:26S proteasome regulatory subunit N9